MHRLTNPSGAPRASRLVGETSMNNKTMLSAREIEALENTSFASALTGVAVEDNTALGDESKNLSSCISNGSCETGAVCVSTGSCETGAVCVSNGSCVTFGACNSVDCTHAQICFFWTNNAAICGIVASGGCASVVCPVVTVVPVIVSVVCPIISLSGQDCSVGCVVISEGSCGCSIACDVLNGGGADTNTANAADGADLIDSVRLG